MKQEEEKKYQQKIMKVEEIKQNFMAETILIDK